MGQDNASLVGPDTRYRNESLKICVVGAGAAGLAVLKVLKDSEQSKSRAWSVDVYEERDDVGGTWLPAPPVDDPPLTPMYDSIIANLPHPIMCYPSFWFPPSTTLFPPAHVVMSYLRDYANAFELRSHIRLNTSVVSTQWTGADWKVTVRENEAEEEHTYDRLVVANGHYRVPYFPPLPGLDSWQAAGHATHAAWYRAPHYVGDKVLVVGGGYSGADIAAGMRRVCKHLVHAAPGSDTASSGNVTVRGRVVRLAEWSESGARTVHFEDGSQEDDVDYIYLATGYVLSFPFFKDLENTPPALPPPLPERLHNSGMHLFALAHHLFPLTRDFPPSAAAFVGLPVKVAPLPLFEAQAQALVRVFADPTALDLESTKEEILTHAAALRADPAIGDDPEKFAHLWSRFKGREQFDYRDAMRSLVGLDSEEWKVPEWVKVAYENMNKLRRTWKMLVETGEADEWVKGVGEGGNHEWVAVMEKLLERAKATEVSGAASPTLPASP